MKKLVFLAAGLLTAAFMWGQVIGSVNQLNGVVLPGTVTGIGSVQWAGGALSSIGIPKVISETKPPADTGTVQGILLVPVSPGGQYVYPYALPGSVQLAQTAPVPQYILTQPGLAAPVPQYILTQPGLAAPAPQYILTQPGLAASEVNYLVEVVVPGTTRKVWHIVRASAIPTCLPKF